MQPINSRLVPFTLAIVSICQVTNGDSSLEVNKFETQVQPLLQRYCFECHSGNEPEAGIQLEGIDPDIVDGEHFDRWEDIREAFNSGEMPPDDKPQPSASERDLITRWLDEEFKKAKQFGTPKQRGKVRRLTRYELQYALEDLLQFSVRDEINRLPEESTSIDSGLKNSSRQLVISGPHLESYLDVIVSVTNKMKEIVSYEPYSETLDIEQLDTSPEQAFTRDKRKIKPPVALVDKVDEGLVVNPKGYIDLPIPSISQYMFQTLVSAKSNSPGQLAVSIGFTRSDIDPRQNVAELGVIEVAPSDTWQSLALDSFPDSLPRQMTRALDRPFFIRITNRSQQEIFLNAFEYKGNVNSKLTSTLIPVETSVATLHSHIRSKIDNFVSHAFRRPPSKAEVDKYFAAYKRYAHSEEAPLALLSTYKEILCSPKFFYVGIQPQYSPRESENYKLAERLALFLWCSVPDAQLLESASKSELTTPTALATQVDRMLKDEKSKRWVEQFTEQWLQTSALFNIAVDKNYYPRFKPQIKELMLQETVEMMNAVFRNGASALDLLDADYIFANQALAAYYGIKGVRGAEFRKVEVGENNHRGGLLTQGTFLVGNSDGMNSHAILRGVWLSSVILNDPPPDPPKNVPPLDESIPGFDKMTLNEKLFVHRNHDACRNCHQRIDPWGIPFENYDASGAWREKVLVVAKETVQVPATGKNSKSKNRKRKRTVLKKSYVGINRDATLPDGASIDGVEDLKRYLISERKRDFAEGLVERILAYALSRDIDYHDEELVNQLVDQFEQHDYSIPDLLLTIVASDQFR